MVPANYSVFFTTMAAAGATLFGLIFVAISIAPENVTGATSVVDRQARATAAYVALLNPLLVSLFALVPYQLLGIAVNVVSWVGIINTLAISVTLFQHHEHEYDRWRNLILIIISLILYSFELYVAIQLEHFVVSNLWFSLLADLLIIITLFGIIRAWELIGIHRFRLIDWYSIIVARWYRQTKNRESSADSSEAKRKD